MMKLEDTVQCAGKFPLLVTGEAAASGEMNARDMFENGARVFTSLRRRPNPFDAPPRTVQIRRMPIFEVPRRTFPALDESIVLGTEI